MSDFAYRESLEKARKAVLDRKTQFSAPDAAEQVKRQEEGLMRPRSRPEADPNAGGIASGVGQALMEIMADQKEEEAKLKAESTEFAPTESGRPVAKPEGDFSSFAARMKKSESGGKSDVQISIEDGRTMTGSYQFGDARLADYKRANKTEFTTEEFRTNPDLQEKVFAWHVSDIDRAINKLAGSENFSRDGLRAVAHLGGTGGMRKYVKSGGTYDPADEFGTSLSKYYNKFK